MANASLLVVGPPMSWDDFPKACHALQLLPFQHTLGHAAHIKASRAVLSKLQLAMAWMYFTNPITRLPEPSIALRTSSSHIQHNPQKLSHQSLPHGVHRVCTTSSKNVVLLRKYDSLSESDRHLHYQEMYRADYEDNLQTYCEHSLNKDCRKKAQALRLKELDEIGHRLPTVYAFYNPWKRQLLDKAEPVLIGDGQPHVRLYAVCMVDESKMPLAQSGSWMVVKSVAEVDHDLINSTVEWLGKKAASKSVIAKQEPSSGTAMPVSKQDTRPIREEVGKKVPGEGPKLGTSLLAHKKLESIAEFPEEEGRGQNVPRSKSKIKKYPSTLNIGSSQASKHPSALGTPSATGQKVLNEDDVLCIKEKHCQLKNHHSPPRLFSPSSLLSLTKEKETLSKDRQRRDSFKEQLLERETEIQSRKKKDQLSQIPTGVSLSYRVMQIVRDSEFQSHSLRSLQCDNSALSRSTRLKPHFSSHQGFTERTSCSIE